MASQNQRNLTPQDEAEILKRELAAGIGEAGSIETLLAGLTGKDAEEAVKREKQELREEYFREKQQ